MSLFLFVRVGERSFSRTGCPAWAPRSSSARCRYGAELEVERGDRLDRTDALDNRPHGLETHQLRTVGRN
jgi:hypothetical protein